MKIIKNSILCMKCYEEIESRSNWDFVWCKCKTVAVDGGKEYCKRIGSLYIDTSIYVLEGNEDVRLFEKYYIIWSPYSEKNPDTIFLFKETACAYAAEISKAHSIKFYVMEKCE